MVMKYNKIIMAMALMVGVVGCSVEESKDNSEEPLQVVFKAAPFLDGDDGSSTKTYVTPNENYSAYEFYWSAQDTVGIFPSEGKQMAFSMANGAGASSATFDGGAWTCKVGYTYSSYFPFIGNYYLDPKAIPVSFKGMKQVGNANSDHFQKYDYMYAPATTKEGSFLNFSYKHLISAVLVWVELPAGHYNGLTLTLDEPLFVTKGEYDLTAASPAIVGTQFADKMHVDLDVTLDQADILKVYVPIAPVNMAGKSLEVKVYGESGSFSYTYNPSKAYAAGNIYRLRATSTVYTGGDYYSHFDPEDNALHSLETIPQAYYGGMKSVIYRHMRYQPLDWAYGFGKDHLTGNVSDEYQVLRTTYSGPVFVDIYPLMKVQYYINLQNADLSGASLRCVLEKNMDYIQTRSNASANFDVVIDHWEEGARNGRRTLDVWYRVQGDAAVVDAASGRISALALELTTADGKQVISDYAAIYRQDVNNLRIVNPKAVSRAKFRRGMSNQSIYRPGATTVPGTSVDDEHYRRTIYGMNFFSAGTLPDPDSWIVKNTNPLITALDPEVRKPNYRESLADNQHFSCDTVIVYSDRNFDLMSIVAAHGWSDNCTLDELNNDALAELGLQWLFETVMNYAAGDPLTYQENFVWLNELGNHSVVVDPAVGGTAKFLTHAFDVGNDTPSVASIGRHPVIRVSLIDPNNKDTSGNPNVVEAVYVKVLIVDDDATNNPQAGNDELAYDFHINGSEGILTGSVFTQTSTNYSNPIVFNCNNGFNGTTTIQWLNETVYNSYGDMYTFHTNYVFNAMNAGDPGYVAYSYASNTGELGTVTEILASNPSSGSSHVINWQLSPEEVWSVASIITAPREIVRHCKYTYGSNTITISMKVKIAPFSTVFNLDYNSDPSNSDYIAQYWIAHAHDAYMAQFEATAYHVATPTYGSTEASYCTFVNDLNASFVTHDGTIAGYPAGTLKVMRDGVAPYNIRYYFHNRNVVNSKTFVKPGDETNKVEKINIRVSADGLTLYACKGVLTAAQRATNTYEALVATGIAASSIFPVAVITNTSSGPIGRYNTITYQENDLAEELLNTDAFYAYIGAAGDICTAPATPHPVSITFHGQQYFKADFLRPVSIETTTPAHFIDGMEFGDVGTYIRYEDIIQPYDWRLNWNGYDSHFNPNHTNYWQFYGLAPAPYHFIIHADLSGATCDIGGTGSAIPATIVLQANEIDNQAEYAPLSWAGLSFANDADWYTDLAGVNTTVYSFNRTTYTPLQYVLQPADISAGRQSQYGWLTYYNSGYSVGAFHIVVPMVVWYKWGKVVTKVTISVEEII